MLNPADSTKVDIDTNEALLAVIGFLEACAPRMVELVEAAAQGVLKEETFEKCLVVNDRLLKTLGDLDNGGAGPPSGSDATAAAPTPPVAAVAAAQKPDGFTDLDDLLLDVKDDNSGKPNAGAENTSPIGGGKTTGEEDPFGGGTDVLVPTPLAGAKPPGAAAPAPAADGKQAEKDDFDVFFQERTTGQQG